MAKFTIEQIEFLKSLDIVTKVSESHVDFTTDFKTLAVTKWSQGVSQQFFFTEYGLYSVLGERRISSAMKRWRKQINRPEGFARSSGSGRPKAKTFHSAEEENRYLKQQIEYQKQEIEFLKKMKALEVKYQRKKNIE